MGEIFETMMLVCFGVSWPLNIAKSYRSRTAYWLYWDLWLSSSLIPTTSTLKS